jgi:hypothetical protein
MSVPADTDEIIPEWLTAVLREEGAVESSRVTSIQSAAVGQLGFFGQIPRLQISYDKPEPGAPRSLVARFSATHPEARAVAHSMGFYEREIGFYRELASDCPVRTPRCYFGEVEMDSGASLLLLEDLSWMHNLNSAGGSVEESELVIREVAKLHAAWWGDARLDQIPWLTMKGMMTPDQASLVFTQSWESFMGKLSIPVTEELLKQCRDDYRMALVMTASRLATGVGLLPGVTATPGGFWNIVFPRYAQALADLGVGELLYQRFG